MTNTELREKLVEMINSAADLCPVEREVIADHLIDQGVTFAKDTDVPNKWISVKDEKPKCRGHYFIAFKFKGWDMHFFGEAMWHDDIPDNGYVKGDHFSNEGVGGMYVTHWMKIPKLPETPKEE